MLPVTPSPSALISVLNLPARICAMGFTIAANAMNDSSDADDAKFKNDTNDDDTAYDANDAKSQISCAIWRLTV